jgi:hypothetical protein
MNRDELEKQLKPNLIDLVLQQQDTIEGLRTRIARLEGSQVRARDEHSHSRVSRRRFRRFYYQLKYTNYRNALFVILGIILTVMIVMAMNGYFWFLLYR